MENDVQIDPAAEPAKSSTTDSIKKDMGSVVAMLRTMSWLVPARFRLIYDGVVLLLDEASKDDFVAKNLAWLIDQVANKKTDLSEVKKAVEARGR